MSREYEKQTYLNACMEFADWVDDLQLSKIKNSTSQIEQAISSYSTFYREFSNEIGTGNFVLSDRDAEVYLLGGTALASVLAYTQDWDNCKKWCDYLLSMMNHFNWEVHPQIRVLLQNWQKRSTHNVRMLDATVDAQLDNPSVARGCLEWIILIVVVFFIIKFIFF